MTAINYFILRPNTAAESSYNAKGKPISPGRAKDRLQIGDSPARYWIAIDKISESKTLKKPTIYLEGQWIYLNSNSLKKRLHLSQTELDENINCLEHFLIETIKKIQAVVTTFLQCYPFAHETCVKATKLMPFIAFNFPTAPRGQAHYFNQENNDAVLIEKLPNDTLNIFLEDKLIQKGGCAGFYQLSHVNDGRKMGLKRIQKYKEAFIKESKILREFNSLGHVWGIQAPPITDVYTPEGMLLGRIDVLYEKNLYDYVNSACIDAVQAIQMMEQLLCGLRFIHSLGYAYCDLKPSNILVTTLEETKLFHISDFGGAVDEGFQNHLHSKGFTPEKEFHEMRAEKDGKIKLLKEQQRDIFSLGMIIFWVITEKWPYSGTKYLDTSTPPLSLKEHSQVKGAPLEIEQLIEQMINPKPEERPTASTAHNLVKDYMMHHLSAEYNVTENLIRKHFIATYQV